MSYPLIILVIALAGALFFISRQQGQIARLELEARHDPLTGLPNRRGLAYEWEAMPRERALILIDLVGFKAVNDTHGHIVGDVLLRKVAERLAAAMPPGGILARWGGDEFVAMVPATQADTLYLNMKQSVEQPFDLSEGGGPANVGIGVRMGNGNGEQSLGPALMGASASLMEARRAG